MQKELELLKDCLENRAPILYVGAGFSYNCVNRKNYHIPLASGLCTDLYKYFWEERIDNVDSHDTIEKTKDYAYKLAESSDLKRLCQVFRFQNMLNERNNYFSELFTGCSVSNDDIRNSICEYPWSKIFTVNIDDLMENIYSSNSKKLNIWNRNSDDKRHYSDYPTLIKLHGCINNPDYGYVFDETEYRAFLANQDYILTEFADAFSKNDIIFIGTELQEDDLKSIIETYANKGYESSKVNHYYFVTPTINDNLTCMEIESSDNMHHIPMKATEFCEFLRTKIQLKNELCNKLKENGLVNVYDVYRKLPTSYVSKLYHGAELTYTDLRDNWDITDCHSDLMEWAKKDDNNKIIALHGKDYVGKTCMAKRLLYSFFTLNYDCYEFKLDSTDKIELFIDYINTSENNIAVLYEGAAYLYELLVQKFIDNNPHKKRIILITTDSTYNHKRKYHSLLKNNNCKELIVSEKINNNRAELIYDKLNEKHSLSRLTDISSKKDDIIKFIIDNNDIIDVLYFSSLGRRFEEHINTFIISDLNEDDYVKKQISIFCLLNRVGITFVPKLLFLNASKVINPAFNQKVFMEKTKQIIQFESEYYHLRYIRYLSSVYANILSNSEIVSILKSLIKHIAGRFNEGDYNELSSILYKLLNLRSLENILSNAKIKQLYQDVEEQCKEYSYYWVQRGICAQKQKTPDFEEADRFLREAKRIRPESYQVSHAVAKNLIERGLQSFNDSSTYFFEGMEQMQSLIENKKYSRALSYSIHAYIDSWLKYCNCTSYILSDEECFLINEYVGMLNQEEIDSSLSRIFFRLKKYAYNNGISSKLKNITKKYWNDLQDSEESEELVESDWII